MNIDVLKDNQKIKVHSIEFDDNLLTEIIEIDKVNEIIKIAYKNDIFLMKPEKDERVVVKIPGADALYYFNTKIEETNEGEAYFVVNLPSEIQRKQDRNFVRININLSLDIVGEHHKTKAVSTNISGGGICFFCKTHFVENQLVEVSFKNTFGKVYSGIKVRIKYIRVLPNNIYEYGSEFLVLEETMREELISYLFELEVRRKMEEGM